MEETITRILADYSSVPLSEIRPESNLQADLGLNSLDVINLVVEFEDTFGIGIDEPDIRSFQTVQDLFNYLAEHTAAKQEQA